MGGENSKAKKLDYEAKNWQEVERSTFYEVVRNNNGQEAQLYHFNIKSDRELQDEVNVYTSRKNNANWVQVIGAKIHKGGFGFCGSQENANILTERIPVLLHSISRLNKQQSNVVLFNALVGFSEIAKLVVPSGITDKMIGFNSQGKTKVWVNENFGMNHSLHSSHDSEVQVSEAQIINNVINAIASKLDLPANYLQSVGNSNSFDNALNFIRTNSGISEGVLTANTINTSQYIGHTPVSVLQDNHVVNVLNSGVSNPVSQQSHLGYVQSSSLIRPPVQTYVPSNIPQSGYRAPNIHWNHNPVGSTSLVTPVMNPTGNYRVVSNNYIGGVSKERISEHSFI